MRLRGQSGTVPGMVPDLPGDGDAPPGVPAAGSVPVPDLSESGIMIGDSPRQRPKQTFRGTCAAAFPAPLGRAEAGMTEAFFSGVSSKPLAQRLVSGAWPCRMY